jgi:hypothetical protein
MPATLEFNKTYCYTWSEYKHFMTEGGQRTIPAQPSNFIVIANEPTQYEIEWLNNGARGKISKGCPIHLNSVEVKDI